MQNKDEIKEEGECMEDESYHVELIEEVLFPMSALFKRSKGQKCIRITESG
jgi:hypothetical protein